MKRILIVFGLVALLASAAWAVMLAGVLFTDDGLTLTATGGLGDLAADADVVVTMQAVADTDRECLNPAGKKPKGQNKGFVKVKAVQEIPATDIVGGFASFALTTEPPDCPNPRWTQTLSTMSFTSAQITVEQPPGVVVLEVDCDIVPASADGLIPPANVVCVP